MAGRQAGRRIGRRRPCLILEKAEAVDAKPTFVSTHHSGSAATESCEAAALLL